jgi:hypothetical protein
MTSDEKPTNVTDSAASVLRYDQARDATDFPFREC